jgi:serine/threonine-protein kinase
MMIFCVAAALVVGAIIAGVAVWMLRPAEMKRIVRFDYDLPDDQVFTREGGTLAAVSPDGTKIVYVANRQLYLRDLNEPTARPIQGTNQDPANPFFSPDGQWVAYYSVIDRQLKKIAVSGGVPVTLCDIPSEPFGSTWAADDRIMFGQSNRIMGISANGGTAEPLVEAKEDELVYGPRALPGGAWILFSITSAGGRVRWDEAQIVAQSLKTGERKVLVPKGSDGQYAPTGHLVYALGNALFAIPLDVNNLETTGDAVPIIEGTQRASQPQFYTATANYGFSDGGLLVYVQEAIGGVIEERESPVWISGDGKEEHIKVQPRDYDVPQISPDGKQVAFDVDTGGNLDIWVWDFVRETMERLTFHEDTDVNPLWTPDGKRIVFSSNREGSMSIYWKAADGTGEVELLCSVPDRSLFTGSWSGDGNVLVLMELDQSRSLDIGILSMEADREHELLLHDSHNEVQPRISPDGRWMAYMSDESGRYEVYVRPFPDVNKGMWQISENGGNEPRWSRDGRELFYRSGDAIMGVSVKTDPGFSSDTPMNLIRGVRNYVLRDWCTFWDVSPDSKRFLVLKELTGDVSTEGTSRPKINIVLNWFEELKDRVPTH